MGKANTFLPRKTGDLFFLWFYFFFRVFRVFPWLIIKISIMGLTPHAHQFPGALFVRRRRVPLVNKHYENDVLLHS